MKGVAQASNLSRRGLFGVAQTSCFSQSAAFPQGFTDKPQSFQKRETLRYLADS